MAFGKNAVAAEIVKFSKQAPSVMNTNGSRENTSLVALGRSFNLVYLAFSLPSSVTSSFLI